MEIIFSDRAKKQLTRILVYFDQRNGSSTYSDKLLNKILQKLSMIDHDIIIGVATRRKNVCRLRVENYVIEYRLDPASVEVLAIFDARRNVRANRFGL